MRVHRPCLLKTTQSGRGSWILVRSEKTSSCQLELMLSISRVKRLDQMSRLMPQEKIYYFYCVGSTHLMERLQARYLPYLGIRIRSH